MKTKISFLIFFIAFSTSFLFAQHENDNWLFGNSKWRFDNTTPNGFTNTTNLTPTIRYGRSVISDKNTGELLFSCNGYNVYNKNGPIMDSGDHLFGTPITWQYDAIGNPSDQSSIIVPDPGNPTRYYVFYINGDRTLYDQSNVPNPSPMPNYGLRYAIVDMSLNNGLGKVISKNNVLFTNSATNALTSTFGSDGNSYWIVTANNGSFLSYKLDITGLNTTAVVSPGANYGSFIKISPNAKRLVTRKYKSVWLHDFNNATGIVTSPVNIIPNDNLASSYNDGSGNPNSAEFSPDSNIIYFIGAENNLCLPPFCQSVIGWSGLCMYNISTGTLIGAVNNAEKYIFSLNAVTASIQLAKNGKIYLMYNRKLYSKPNENNINEVLFGTITNELNFIPFGWKVINTPDVWSPIINPLSSIDAQSGTRNGFSFPQLIPSAESSGTCPDVRYITTPVTSSQIFQAGKAIFASSAINNNLSVEYKAGENVSLLPGFVVRGEVRGEFKAYIGPCAIASFARDNVSNAVSVFAKTREVAVSSEVKIYPNPVSDLLTIKSASKVGNIEIYDVSGRKVNGVLNGDKVDVKGLPAGSYMIIIETKDGRTVSKFIKK